MRFLEILGRDLECNDLADIIRILKWAFRGICIVIPVIIIILIIIDVAKVATSGNVDDKMKKEVGQKAVTRLIYAVVIFLIPTVVSLIFDIIPLGEGANVATCWNDVDDDSTTPNPTP